MQVNPLQVYNIFFNIINKFKYILKRINHLDNIGGCIFHIQGKPQIES